MNDYVGKPFKPAELLDKIQQVLAVKSEKEFTNPTVIESILVKITEKKAVDLTYLDTIMENDKNLKMEMIELFVQNVPNDVAILGKAILEQDIKEMKRIAHYMKSSLAMFSLVNEVAFLEKTERNANISRISDGIVEEFALFKSELGDTIEAMKEINFN